MNEIIKRILTSLVFGSVFFGFYFIHPLLFSVLLVAILIFILMFEWPTLITFNSLEFWFLTPAYPILPIISLLYLNYSFYSIDKLIPLYPFFVSWASDTGSFIMGKLFGKHKICPTISPGKSWEGLMGGILSVIIMNLFLRSHSVIISTNPLFKTPFQIILLSAGLAVFGFLGDIFISFLKRRKHVKDSGNILPGHGGFLDRFDSVFFVAVIILPLFLSFI